MSTDYTDDDDVPPRRRPTRQPSAPTPLVILLQEYNAALGWSQARLAEECGFDTAALNKLFTGKHPRPHYPTLKRIAHAYQQAGLNVTAQLLAEARDREVFPDSDTGIPDQWMRLVRRVLAYPAEVQDSFFRKWSLDFQETTHLMNMRQQKTPPPDLE